MEKGEENHVQNLALDHITVLPRPHAAAAMMKDGQLDMAALQRAFDGVWTAGNSGFQIAEHAVPLRLARNV